MDKSYHRSKIQIDPDYSGEVQDKKLKRLSKDEADAMKSLYDKYGASRFKINEIVYILHEQKIRQLTRSVNNLPQRVKELENDT